MSGACQMLIADYRILTALFTFFVLVVVLIRSRPDGSIGLILGNLFRVPEVGEIQRPGTVTVGLFDFD